MLLLRVSLHIRLVSFITRGRQTDVSVFTTVCHIKQAGSSIIDPVSPNVAVAHDHLSKVFVLQLRDPVQHDQLTEVYKTSTDQLT